MPKIVPFFPFLCMHAFKAPPKKNKLKMEKDWILDGNSETEMRARCPDIERHAWGSSLIYIYIAFIIEQQTNLNWQEGI